MKKILLSFFLIIALHSVTGQITTPIIKANFGVDADLRSNYFNGFVQSGNDDWFSNSAGTGQFIIDTTGAAAIVSGYSTNLASRRLPFYRGMRFAPYSVINNRLLIDAVFIRDYHGDDSTIFAAGSNKNGMSPATWTCPVSQSIPDKNDILDMMVHVRRAGPNTTDSLWMFGGLSIENTTGNRYFDFEMYQTDIYYNRATRQFYNYGNEAGHTAWLFDASGNITRPGDIVFTAEYGSSSLTLLEARIWVDRASLAFTPTAFNWTGSFDGASSGAQYGYAGILPNTAGAFYTGLQSVNNTWGGPFAIVLGNNSLVSNYIARQYMEFGVNLTKLGLDPVTLLGGSACGMPFRRILVKTRSATSFTAELKDFVGPFDLFLPSQAEATADFPWLCGSQGISTLTVTNPIPTSYYVWSTTNGNIVGSNTGTSITVDTSGTYVVSHYLQSGCSLYATDTIVITYTASCGILDKSDLNFSAKYLNGNAQLKWTANINERIRQYEVQRSIDGIHFGSIQTIEAIGDKPSAGYETTDKLAGFPAAGVYYRLKITDVNNAIIYSTVSKVTIPGNSFQMAIMPNPVRDKINIHMYTPYNTSLQISVYDVSGKLVYVHRSNLQQGAVSISIPGTEKWPPGMYTLVSRTTRETKYEKVVVVK